jgi:cytochrome o ubiquinol oxidase operon protein cyoD
MKDQAPKIHKSNPANLATYIGGFLLSLLLTFVAYFLVQRHVASHHTAISHGVLVFMIISLAIIQLFVQLTFFLHVDSEPRPRWKLTALLFAGLVLLIVVFGSLWIMNNLNYHMESPTEQNKYIQSQSDL